MIEGNMKVTVGQLETCMTADRNVYAHTLFNLLSRAILPEDRAKPSASQQLNLSLWTATERDSFQQTSQELATTIQDLQVLQTIVETSHQIGVKVDRNERAYRLENAARHQLGYWITRFGNLPVDKLEDAKIRIEKTEEFLERSEAWRNKAVAIFS